MNGQEPASVEQRLNLLIFSVGGVSCAVDTDQIESVRDYEPDDTGDLLWSHRLLGFDGQEVCYRKPAVLALKCSDAESLRVVIDGMEDIADYGMEAMAPLPALLEPLAGKRGIWGVLRRNHGLTMLVDLCRAANRPF